MADLKVNNTSLIIDKRHFDILNQILDIYKDSVNPREFFRNFNPAANS